MNKPITRFQHGFADYAYAPLAAAAPRLFGFEKEKTATLLCQILGGGVLLNTLFTRAEWGAVKTIPFKVHLATDVIAGALTMAAPWLFGFAKNKPARNTFLALGGTSLVAGLITQPEEMPENQ
ncbi:SPW repeat domain-containing protein [Hymenobacter jejuensis]|uniref:SPW repeat-containing integral membrane domain-containing protein n=1 Tax=Hymenobacter jejuensis TaxID=2502781 RepID=A0A5B8A1I1_9BACT|nr:hypothetical protein [Hymenobacter jejuensis]QDA61180.1 hypothetical protein FHG12_14190 [Hymenobacter jejuensis]